MRPGTKPATTDQSMHVLSGAVMMPALSLHKMFRMLALAVLAGAPGLAHPWDLSGTRAITLEGRDGTVVPIGTVSFHPQGARTAFKVHLDHERFKDFFLSMREFKCLEGPEVFCHVPYPHRNPATVTRGDLAWLEHALLFLHKSPAEFGARLWNGVYYRMQVTPDGIVGIARAVDLNHIGAPPDDAGVPPYQSADTSDIDPASRWLGRLKIR